MEKIGTIFLLPLLRRGGTAFAVWLIATMDFDANLEKIIFEWVVAGIAIAGDIVMAYGNRRAIETKLLDKEYFEGDR